MEDVPAASLVAARMSVGNPFAEEPTVPEREDLASGGYQAAPRVAPSEVGGECIAAARVCRGGGA